MANKLPVKDIVAKHVMLDAQGMLCPLPVLRARKAMKELSPGSTIEVLATDPGSVKDFIAFCETTGDELIETSETSGVLRFLIRKR